MDKFNQIVQFVQSLEGDFQKFYVKEQAAAGTRVRKGLSELRKLCQEVRNDVQVVKAERKGQK
jgi:hypothetical protein